MKKLLFRSWDKKNKHFVYFELFEGVNNHTPKIYEDGEFEEWKQYTGLKDKNGKEIYEGDILKNTKHYNQLVEVLWKGCVTNYECKEIDSHLIKWGGWNFRKLDKDNRLTYAIYDNYIEVIGNIYENPELLK